MSDIEEYDEEEYDEEDVESSDDEIIEVHDLPSDDISAPSSNKFMDILLTNMKYPSKFVVHALMLHRVKALFSNAKPLSSNPPPPGNEDYTSTFIKIVRIAVDEVMENKSPMMFYNPITKTHMSANDFDKTLFKKIMYDSIDLAID